MHLLKKQEQGWQDRRKYNQRILHVAPLWWSLQQSIEIFSHDKFAPLEQADRLLWWTNTPSAYVKVCSDRLKRGKEEVSCDAVRAPIVCLSNLYMWSVLEGSFVEWPIEIDRYSSHPGGRKHNQIRSRGRSSRIMFFCMNAANQMYLFHRKHIAFTPLPKSLMKGIIVPLESVTFGQTLMSKFRHTATERRRKQQMVP